MISIVSYQKVITPITTHVLRLPDGIGIDDSARCTELATLGDATYVSIPDGVTLPEQPSEITVTPVTLTESLREQIKAASPHVRLINERVRDAIAQRYSIADEIKLLRTAPSPEMAAYNAYAEDCRAWGRSEKARLGL